MDISKPGSAGFGAPILDAGGTPGASGGGRFAEVLSGGQPGGGAPTESRTPFSTPILDAEPARGAAAINRRRVSSPDAEMRAGGHRSPSIQMVGERAGVAPGQAAGLDLRQIANSTMKAESRIESMMNAARRGKTFSPSELLGMQMEVFKYQQTVEVISKTAEKVVSGIKQTLGTQV